MNKLYAIGKTMLKEWLSYTAHFFYEPMARLASVYNSDEKQHRGFITFFHKKNAIISSVLALSTLLTYNAVIYMCFLFPAFRNQTSIAILIFTTGIVAFFVIPRSIEKDNYYEKVFIEKVRKEGLKKRLIYYLFVVFSLVLLPLLLLGSIL